MKAKIITGVVLIVVVFACQAQATFKNWDVYSDAVIEEGDQYIAVNVYDTPPSRTTVSVFGGYADYIHTHDASILNVLGGSVQVVAFDQSVINITGGSHSGAEASDHGVVNLAGDAISRRVGATGFGIANMFGGSVDYLGASGAGTLNLYCVEVADFLGVSSGAVVNVFGLELAKTSLGGKYGYGQISGLWLDNTAFSIDLNGSETYSRVNLVPEATSLTLLGLGVGGLVLKRKT